MRDERTTVRSKEPFRLGDRSVSPDVNEIDGARVDSKAMEVLLALAEAAPGVVSGAALLERIWPDVVVVDNVVYQAVAQLRKVLGDDARAPRYIETVPRRGYRVIAQIVAALQRTDQRDSSTPRPRTRHNLPAQLTSFIGREREVNEIGELLAVHRLVTLTGVGGCGKTRLALAVANARLGGFDDGAWLVELAPATDPAQVESFVAKVLGVREGPGESLGDSLPAALADKRLLLLLDNCEHLVGACADLAEKLLRRAPELRILATSREALRISGEHPWRIQSLATPDPHHLPPLDELREVESVRLFVERTATTQPAFALTQQNAASIAHICSRLDGIPLAIELAAARVHTLSVEEIAARVAESFGLLSRGSRTALPRQRTLQATLDWSHALLTEHERVLLRRLAVFANGFTLAAAEAIGAGDPLTADDIVDLLTSLVERSMVQMVGTVAGAARYRLLEPVRQYSLGRLDESGDEADARDRHRDYFVAFSAELARDRRVGRGSAGLFPRFEAESDNLDLALTRCLENDPENGLQLAANRYEVALTMGDWDTVWLEKFVARTAASAPARHSALFYLALPDPDQRRRRDRLEQALDLVRHVGDQATEARYLAELGNTLVASGEVIEGVRMLESALALARDTGDSNALGWCLLSVVWVSKPALHERAKECIAAFRRAGNDVGLAVALYRFCSEGLLFAEPRVAVPREWVEELLALARVQGNTVFLADALLCLGLLTEQQGDLHEAARLKQQSSDLLKLQGLTHRARYAQTRRQDTRRRVE